MRRQGFYEWLAAAPTRAERAAADERLAGDITYLPTQGGWLYLATVIDLHNREVVGHTMAGHMRAELVCEAITLAARRGLLAQDAIFHSDRGSQLEFNRSSQHRLYWRDRSCSFSAGSVSSF